MRLLFVLGVFPAFLIHCSDDPPAATLGGDAGTGSEAGPSNSGPPGTTPGGQRDGSTDPPSGDAGGDAGGATGNDEDHVGVVTVFENGPSTTESAVYQVVPAVNRCTLRNDGACRVTICPRATNVKNKDVSAGTTTLSGGTGQPIVLTETQGGVQATPRWVAGETISIVASGDVVPAFTASVVYPSAVTVTSPVRSEPDYTIVLARATGARFGWTSQGTAHGSFHAQILQNQGTRSVEISCLFPQSAGEGTIPPAALADLQPGGNPSDTFVQAHGATRSTVTAGAYRVDAFVWRFNPYVANGVVQ